jgi:hypothetical protein
VTQGSGIAVHDAAPSLGANSFGMPAAGINGANRANEPIVSAKSDTGNVILRPA